MVRFTPHRWATALVAATCLAAIADDPTPEPKVMLKATRAEVQAQLHQYGAIPGGELYPQANFVPPETTTMGAGPSVTTPVIHPFARYCLKQDIISQECEGALLPNWK